jgi:uncharacterized membrane protein YdbT with pleckstrin-like domain
MGGTMSIKIPSGFSLMEGERPYWHGRRSLKSLMGSIIAGILLLLIGIPLTALFIGVPFIIIGLILLVRVPLAIISTEYFIASHRMYVKYGIISRRVFEIKNEWITGVIVKQGVLGRMLNYGDVLYSTPGQYAGSVLMVGVSNPMGIRTIVEDILRKHKEAERIEEKIKELEREYELGRITEDRYRELRKKYEEELRKYL